MLRSLLQFLTPDDRKETLFIVYVNIAQGKDSLIASINDEFSKHVEEGLLHIIEPPTNFYPKRESAEKKFKISWNVTAQHSKDNLDIAYLMMYARTKAAFYVQLSLDLLAVPQYATKVKNFAIKKASLKETWFALSFSTQGCSGKLYRSNDLDRLILFFLMYHDVKPCDWIALSLAGTIFCHLEKENCDGVIKKQTRQYRPVLFKKAS